MDERAREVIRIGDGLFRKKESVDALWQEIAYNFYPKMASFTTERDQGEEYADHAFSSYPFIARRELGNALSEYLRPDKWLSIHVDDEEIDNDEANRAFLEYLTEIQWRAMTDPAANLVTAMTPHDHDFAAFGNAVVQYSANQDLDALLFSNHHLRDVVWAENANHKIDAVWRNWSPTARQLKKLFPKTVSKEVHKACGSDGDNGKDPEKPFRCRHVILPSRMYDYQTKGGKKFPFVSLYVELESETVLEEVGQSHLGYVIPRWQRVAGSVFGTSMATDVLLPDGRTLQVMMRTLREAGEMYVNPPMIQIGDAIRGDIAYYPGGITTADVEYDSKIGDVLRPVSQNSSGFPIGIELAAAIKEDIRRGFFLDKIQLPETNSKMTATEVRRRIQEHIRSAAPISKPIQQESNYPLCDGVFQVLLENGLDQIIQEKMPESLDGMELKFKFRSPVDELQEQNEAELYLDNRDRILFPAAQLDPSILEVVDLAGATRDALRSNGWKAKHFKPKEAIEQRRAQMEQEAQANKVMQELAAGGQIAEQAGKGIDALATAGASAQGNGAA
jgi:hypothetical protein